MRNLKSVEQAMSESDDPIYLIFSSRAWEHHDADNCPIPIREWIERHYPDVAIEKLSGFSRKYMCVANDGKPDELLSDIFSPPVFRIGFTPEQVEHFREAWNNPPLDTPESPSNFYLVTCGQTDVHLDGSEYVDFYVTVILSKALNLINAVRQRFSFIR